MNAQDIIRAEGANDRAIARYEEPEAWIDEGYRNECEMGKTGDWIEWVDPQDFAMQLVRILESSDPVDERYSNMRDLIRKNIDYATQRHSEVVVRNGRK